VPTIYSLLKKHPPIDYTREIEEEAGPELYKHEPGEQGNPQQGNSQGPQEQHA